MQKKTICVHCKYHCPSLNSQKPLNLCLASAHGIMNYVTGIGELAKGCTVDCYRKNRDGDCHDFKPKESPTTLPADPATTSMTLLKIKAADAVRRKACAELERLIAEAYPIGSQVIKWPAPPKPKKKDYGEVTGYAHPRRDHPLAVRIRNRLGRIQHWMVHEMRLVEGEGS